MQLFNAIVVFLIANYLKLFLAMAPVCSIWRYYNSRRHAYIIISELILVLVIIFIMFASLAMTKMDCNRLANYLLLPVFLGLGYLNSAYYHRTTWLLVVGNGPDSDGHEIRAKTNDEHYSSSSASSSSVGSIGNSVSVAGAGAAYEPRMPPPPSDTGTSLIDHSNKTIAALIRSSSGGGSTTLDSIVDWIELVSSNGLAVLALVHLTANLFNKQLAKILN